MPGFIVIEQGNLCNLKCKSCPTRLGLRPKGYMKPDAFKDIINQFVKHDRNFINRRLVLHGYGEPLLSPYLWENLDYLEKLNFSKVDFLDNGMLMTEEMARILCKYKCLNWIKISLNSSNKETMEYINTGSNFDVVVENIKKLCDVVKECGQPFGIKVQLMHTSKNKDEKKSDIVKLIGRDNFSVLECTIQNLPDTDLANDLLIPEYEFIGGGCIFAGQSMLIHWDGDIVGCCLDNSKGQVIGNVRDGIFSKMVQDNLSRLRSEFMDKNFKNLPACSTCTGVKK